MAVLKRPGGELASRPLHFIWVVDCSGSMYGEKIGTVNHAIQSTIPDMQDAAHDNPNAQLLVRTLKFSTGASWVTNAPVDIDDFTWQDLDADGVTDIGKAFDMLAAQLTIPPMTDRALPPVLVLLSDGQPTDDYKKSLDKLLHLPWGKKAVRIAISIGQDADDEPENAALAEERRPSYQKFHDVVNDGNEEENNLNQLIPFVKPVIHRAISL